MVKQSFAFRIEIQVKNMDRTLLQIPAPAARTLFQTTLFNNEFLSQIRKNIYSFCQKWLARVARELDFL